MSGGKLNFVRLPNDVSVPEIHLALTLDMRYDGTNKARDEQFWQRLFPDLQRHSFGSRMRYLKGERPTH
jgi:hypothetical protein